MIWIRIYLLLLLLPATSLHGQDANEILQKYFETVSKGSIKNWDTIKSVYIESEGFYSQNDLEAVQPDFISRKVTYSKTYREWPDKLKTEIYEDSTYRKLLSYMLWLGNKKKLILWFNNMQPVVKPIEDVQWDFNPVHFYKLLKNASVKYNGIKNFESDSISCFDIEIRSKDTHINLYINTTGYLLEYWRVFNPSDSSNYTKFYNYKNVDGFLFEMSSHAVTNGRIFHATKKKKIHLNHSIDAEVFNEP